MKVDLTMLFRLTFLIVTIMVALVLAGGDKGGDNIILSGGEGKGHGGNC